MSDLLKDFADFAQEGGYKVYGDYSGRGMYGRKCFGLVGDEHPLGMILKFVSYEFENRIYHPSDCNDDSNEICMNHGDFSEILSFMELMQNTMASDSMGRQAIYYWPDIDYDYPDSNENPE